MDIRINKDTAREMARRLRAAVGTANLSQSQAYEALAATLGHPNWDTLAGLLKRESTEAAQPAFRLAAPITLYVDAFACDEWGEAPSWAQVLVDQAFVDEVLRLHGLVTQQGLDFVSTSWSAEMWDRQDDLRIQGDDLQVSKTAWWLRARPKHADYAVETRMIDVQVLLDVLSGKTHDYLVRRKDMLFYDASGNTQGFIEMLVDDSVLDERYLET